MGESEQVSWQQAELSCLIFVYEIGGAAEACLQVEGAAVRAPYFCIAAAVVCVVLVSVIGQFFQIKSCGSAETQIRPL